MLSPSGSEQKSGELSPNPEAIRIFSPARKEAKSPDADSAPGIFGLTYDVFGYIANLSLQVNLFITVVEQMITAYDRQLPKETAEKKSSQELQGLTTALRAMGFAMSEIANESAKLIGDNSEDNALAFTVIEKLNGFFISPSSSYPEQFPTLIGAAYRLNRDANEYQSYALAMKYLAADQGKFIGLPVEAINQSLNAGLDAAGLGEEKNDSPDASLIFCRKVLGLINQFPDTLKTLLEELREKIKQEQEQKPQLGASSLSAIDQWISCLSAAEKLKKTLIFSPNPKVVEVFSPKQEEIKSSGATDNAPEIYRLTFNILQHIGDLSLRVELFYFVMEKMILAYSKRISFSREEFSPALRQFMFFLLQFFNNIVEVVNDSIVVIERNGKDEAGAFALIDRLNDLFSIDGREHDKLSLLIDFAYHLNHGMSKNGLHAVAMKYISNKSGALGFKSLSSTSLGAIKAFLNQGFVAARLHEKDIKGNDDPSVFCERTLSLINHFPFKLKELIKALAKTIRRDYPGHRVAVFPGNWVSYLDTKASRASQYLVQQSAERKNGRESIMDGGPSVGFFRFRHWNMVTHSTQPQKMQPVFSSEIISSKLQPLPLVLLGQFNLLSESVQLFIAALFCADLVLMCIAFFRMLSYLVCSEACHSAGVTLSLLGLSLIMSTGCSAGFAYLLPRFMQHVWYSPQFVAEFTEKHFLEHKPSPAKANGGEPEIVRKALDFTGVVNTPKPKKQGPPSNLGLHATPAPGSRTKDIQDLFSSPRFILGPVG